MKIKTLTFVAALAFSTAAYAQDAKQGGGTTSTDKPKAPTTGTTGSTDKPKVTKLEADDVKIVSYVAHVDQMEIDAGKLAQKNGTAQVKKYGAMLVKDHTANSKDMKAFAKKKGVAKIPAHKPETEAEQKEHQDSMDTIARLKKLKGAEFDREFLPLMISEHDKAIGRVNTFVTASKDPELADKLRGVLPVLQRHADNARELQKASEATSSAGGPSAKPGPAPKSGTGTTPGATTTPKSTGTGTGATNTTGSKTGTTGSTTGGTTGTTTTRK